MPGRTALGQFGAEAEILQASRIRSSSKVSCAGACDAAPTRRYQRQCRTAGARCLIQLRCPGAQHHGSTSGWLPMRKAIPSAPQILRQQGIQLDAQAQSAPKRSTAPSQPQRPVQTSAEGSGVHKQNEAFTLGAMGQKQATASGSSRPVRYQKSLFDGTPLGVGMVVTTLKRNDRSSSPSSAEPLATFRKAGHRTGEISHGRDRAPEKRQDGSQSHRA